VPFALLFHERFRAEPAHAFVRDLVHEHFAHVTRAEPSPRGGRPRSPAEPAPSARRRASESAVTMVLNQRT
jgi:hypothetical protein